MMMAHWQRKFGTVADMHGVFRHVYATGQTRRCNTDNVSTGRETKIFFALPGNLYGVSLLDWSTSCARYCIFGSKIW